MRVLQLVAFLYRREPYASHIPCVPLITDYPYSDAHLNVHAAAVVVAERVLGHGLCSKCVRTVPPAGHTRPVQSWQHSIAHLSNT